MDSFAEGDPAAKRYAQLVDALAIGPTFTVIEIEVIVRLVSWTSADDILILSHHPAVEEGCARGWLDSRPRRGGGRRRVDKGPGYVANELGAVVTRWGRGHPNRGCQTPSFPTR